MGISKKIKELWERFMFPLDLLYLAVLVFILLMYLDIYRGMLCKFWRKINETYKKTIKKINLRIDK